MQSSAATRRVTLRRAPFAARTLLTGVVIQTVACALPMLIGLPALLSLATTLPMLLLVAWAAWINPPADDREVRVSADGLELVGWRRIDRDAIVGGYVRPERNDCAAAFELANGDTILLSARDRAEAESLLDAAGMSAAQRRLVVRRARTAHRLAALVAGPFVALPFTGLLSALTYTFDQRLPGLVVFSVFVALWVLVAKAYPRLDVAVGVDGFEVGRRFGREFVPWSEVSSVRVGAGRIEVGRADGRTLSLWCNLDETWVAQALVDRMNECLAMHRAGGAAAAALQALDRNGRTWEAWRHDLAALAQRQGGYRDAALTREQLEAVVADPAADPERRVGAAIALESMGSEGATRVRVAAEATAEPTLRAALEGVLEGRDVSEATEGARLRRNG